MLILYTAARLPLTYPQNSKSFYVNIYPLLVINNMHTWRGPAQDAPLYLILWYTAKTIPTLLE